MKKSFFLIFFISFFILFFSFCSTKTKEREEKIDLSKENVKLGYAMGYNFGENINKIEADISKEAVIEGLQDALFSKEKKMTKEEITKVLSDFQKAMIQKSIEERQKLSEANKKEEEEFLKENLKNKKVKVTPSGLQYEVLKEGKGERPKPDDIVIVHYKGMFIDGKVFDSSYKRGEPAKFQLNKVIPGWVEGVQLMRVGAKYRFYIPSKLAYGERGAGNVIGPNKLLIFEVELIGIEKSKKK